MTEPVASEWTAQARAYADAMRCELDWAPLHFDGWGEYEQARPTLPRETIEVIGDWPDRGYTLQYRPVLGELVEAHQTPIDSFPEITVLGRVDERRLAELRSLASQASPDELSDAASRIARPTRTIAAEPPVPTGSIIPAHAEIPVHYLPVNGQWLKAGRLIHQDHASAAYAVAGHWRLRLGPPVGLTPTGLLVFEPLGKDGLRLTIEHPVSQPVGSKLSEAEVGVYRYDGLGGWHQTAVVRRPEELQLLTAQTPALVTEAPFLGGRAHQ